MEWPGLLRESACVRVGPLPDSEQLGQGMLRTSDRVNASEGKGHVNRDENLAG